MSRTKKNKKTNRRGTAAARSAQPRARRDGAQAAATATPPGLLPAKSTLPGLVPGTGEYSKLVPAMSALPGLFAAPGQTAAQAPQTAPAPVAAESGTPPDSTPDGLPAWAAKAVEELLTVTYWLDPGREGGPFSATIRFSGRRIGGAGSPQPADTFWHEETVEGIVPGSGPVAITAEVRGIPSGQWTVTARPVTRGVRPYPPGGNEAGALRVPWPRRVVIPAGPGATVRTSSLLRSKVPGIIRFAYASLVSLAVLTGLGLEALLLARGHYPAFRPLVFSAVAIVAGVVGGKAWYVAVHRGRKFDGWCIQGFVAGAAVVVAAAAFAGPGIPRGVYLGVVAPALLIGMAIWPARVLLGRLLHRPADRVTLGNLVVRPSGRLPARARAVARGAGRADHRGGGAGRRPAHGAPAVRSCGRDRVGGLHPEQAVHPRPAGRAAAVAPRAPGNRRGRGHRAGRERRPARGRLAHARLARASLAGDRTRRRDSPGTGRRAGQPAGATERQRARTP